MKLYRLRTIVLYVASFVGAFLMAVDVINRH
jgi:hypothetical protein